MIRFSPCARWLLACGALSLVPAGVRGSEFSAGLGVGLENEFEGSDHYQAFPLPAFEYDADWGSIQSDQLGVAVDVVPSEQIDAGPVVRYLFGRTDSIHDDVIRRLRKTDDTIQAGLFLQSGLPASLLGITDPSILVGRLEGLTDVGGGEDGATLEASLGVLRPFGKHLSLYGEFTTTLADSDYMRSFFGITPAGSRSSGLPPYKPSAGFKDVGFTLVADQDLSGPWSLEAIASYSYLIGDAGDSPIVDDRGSRNQWFGGLTLNYQFW